MRCSSSSIQMAMIAAMKICFETEIDWMTKMKKASMIGLKFEI